MADHAEEGDASDRESQDLYQGSTDEIESMLKLWVPRRKVKIEEQALLVKEAIEGQDLLESLPENSMSPEDKEYVVSGIMAETEDIFNHLEVLYLLYTRLNRMLKHNVQLIKQEFEFGDLIAAFLLGTLKHRGFNWPKLLCHPRAQSSADVCAALGVLDNNFQARAELAKLFGKKRVDAWQAENNRRVAEYAQELGEDAIDGVENSLSRGLHFPLYQGITIDPTISIGQAILNAAALAPGYSGNKSPSPATDYSAETSDDTLKADDTIKAATILMNAANLGRGPSTGAADSTSANSDTPTVPEALPASQASSKTKKRNEARRRAKTRKKQDKRSSDAGADEHGASQSTNESKGL